MAEHTRKVVDVYDEQLDGLEMVTFHVEMAEMGKKNIALAWCREALLFGFKVC